MLSDDDKSNAVAIGASSGEGGAASTEKPKCCVFYDMTHSNNSARIRLWLQLKGVGENVVKIRRLSMADLRKPDYERINPHKKVPAFVTDRDLCLFEASVIMLYLEDRFGHQYIDPPLLPTTSPDDRAFCHLLTRCHDLYVASPNSNQPNFSHTQGCMYLDPVESNFTPARRTMDAKTRASKLAELYQQFAWLNSQARLPFLVGDTISHADLTWFPTMVFAEFMLPKSFGWSDQILNETEVFPKLSKWYQHCIVTVPELAKVRKDILTIHQADYSNGRLALVIEDVKAHPQYKWKYM